MGELIILKSFYRTRAAQENVENPILTPKSLLIILDDAETLFENEETAKFVDEVKTLMKEDLVKVLVLCDDDEETKSKAGEMFDQDFSHLNGKKSGHQVIQDFEQYIVDFTGLKVEEAKKFVDTFGFDIFELINVKSVIQDCGDSNNLKETENLFEHYLEQKNTSKK